MKARDQIIKLIKQNEGRETTLPEISIKSISSGVDLVEKFKFEFERAGGIFIRTKLVGIFDEVSKILQDEKVDKIFIENFGNELDDIFKSLPVKQIIMQPHSKEQIAQVDASITGCDFLIAETGTIAFIHRENRFKSGALLPRLHIVIANEGQIYETLGEVLVHTGGKFDSILLITGPSRTADIEKVIVQGVHGPQKVYLILI